VDLGFNPNHVFVVAMNPALNNYSTDQSARFFKTLLDRTATLPGVKSASLTAIPPFLGGYSWDISIDGYMSSSGDTVVDTLTNRVSPRPAPDPMSTTVAPAGRGPIAWGLA
jgi:hypothetical protein